MAAPRHRTRLIRATVLEKLVAGMDAAGWVTASRNFGLDQAVKFIDYLPDDRNETVTAETIAVSLGDVDDTIDLEIGAGLQAIEYPIFIDCYASQQAISEAMCDDIRDIFEFEIFPLRDFTTAIPTDIANVQLEVLEFVGPRKPSTTVTLDGFKRYWRVNGLRVEMRFIA